MDKMGQITLALILENLPKLFLNPTPGGAYLRGGAKTLFNQLDQKKSTFIWPN